MADREVTLVNPEKYCSAEEREKMTHEEPSVSSLSTPSVVEPREYMHSVPRPGGGVQAMAKNEERAKPEWWRNLFNTCWRSEERSSSRSDSRCHVRYKLQGKPRVPIYTMHHSIEDAIKSAVLSHGLQGGHVARLVVEFCAVYRWSGRAESCIQVYRGHDNTIARNSKCEFGVVLGSSLDPSVDHVITLRVDDGVEFGIGVCTNKNASCDAKRDFMCEAEGWGYYNYKSKFVGMKPKYPSGWYKETHSCMKHYPEDEVLMGGDILTMTVTREGLDKSYDYSKPALGNGRFTVGFFKNDKPMGQIFNGIKGNLHLCLNYYFMATTIRLLSDHRTPLRMIAEHLRLKI